MKIRPGFDGDDPEEQLSKQTIKTDPQRITKATISKVIDELSQNLAAKFDLIGDSLEGSGWRIKRYILFAVDIFETRPVRGSSYIPTPARYAHPKCGLINIHNTDQECFRWCMRYHQSKKQKNDDRITALQKLTDKYDYTGIDFPTSYDDIEKFEETNNVCIYVYKIDEESDDIVAEKPGRAQYLLNDCIYLLRIEDELSLIHI